MTSASTCWATTGSPLCSQASRAERCESADGPVTTRALGARRPYRSSSARWQTTARSAPATSRAPISPSTYRPSAPRSAGTSVASISTRGATTALAPSWVIRPVPLGRQAVQYIPVMDVPSAIKPTPCTKQERALTPSRRPRPGPGVEHARAQWRDVRRSARGDRLAGLDVLQVRDGLAERADLDHLQAGRDRALDVRAVGRGGQEDRRARVTGAHHLLLDA